MQVEFTKPEGGGLGFALVGGNNGSMLRVREICSGGVAEQDGRLRVGDVLLEVRPSLRLASHPPAAVAPLLTEASHPSLVQVNGVIVSGLSHNKVVDILRKAEGAVQLTICRDILPLAYSESPTPPNMSAQTKPVLAEQPAPASSPETCTSPEDKVVERPPGTTFKFFSFPLTWCIVTLQTCHTVFFFFSNVQHWNNTVFR